jgi:hypothetical protein
MAGFTDRLKGKQQISSGSVQQFGKGTAQTPGGGQIFSTQASTGINLANVQTESTMATYTLPPNSLDVPGRNLWITAFGNFPLTDNKPRQAKLTFGSKSITIAQSTTGGVAQSWCLQYTISKSGPSQQVCMTSVMLSSLHGGMTISTATETDTSPIAIKVTGTSTGAAGVGEVVLYNLQVQALN